MPLIGSHFFPHVFARTFWSWCFSNLFFPPPSAGPMKLACLLMSTWQFLPVSTVRDIDVKSEHVTLSNVAQVLPGEHLLGT